MRSGRKLGTDPVVDAYPPARQRNAHDPRLAHHLPGTVAGHDGFEQAGLEAVDLPAGTVQAGDPNNGVGPDPQVVEALARALRLTDTERGLIFRLAGQAVPGAELIPTRRIVVLRSHRRAHIPA